MGNPLWILYHASLRFFSYTCNRVLEKIYSFFSLTCGLWIRYKINHNMVIVVDSMPPPNSSWTMWPMFWSESNRISSSLPDSKASFCIFSIMSTRSLSFSSVRVSYNEKKIKIRIHFHVYDVKFLSLEKFSSPRKVQDITWILIERAVCASIVLSMILFFIWYISNDHKNFNLFF